MQIPEGETGLARRLKQRIRAEGPIRFDAFMEAALYDPDLGYYACGPDIGPGGDFSTSVRFPPFRKAVARFAKACWESLGKPETFRFVELGGGTGELARAVTEAWIEQVPNATLEYVTVDASPGLRKLQEAVPGVRAVATTRDLEPAPGLVFGNEVLDALPVRRVMGARDGGLVELYVGLDERLGLFKERLLPAVDDALKARFDALGLRPQPNQWCDVAMGLDAFVADAARLADPGWLVFIDYGDPAERLYHPTRLNGTLAAYRGHGKFFNPFERVGEQDLTADVDFTTTTHAATATGMTALGITAQQHWLEALGIDDLGLPEDVRMVAGAANLGSAFFVLAFSRGVDEAVPGFG